MIDPRSGLSRPTRVLRKTDLPVPEGPSITEISPAGRVRVTSCQITWRPKDFVSPSTPISTPTCTHTSPLGGSPHGACLAGTVWSTSARPAGYAQGDLEPGGRPGVGRLGDGSLRSLLPGETCRSRAVPDSRGRTACVGAATRTGWPPRRGGAVG